MNKHSTQTIFEKELILLSINWLNRMSNEIVFQFKKIIKRIKVSGNTLQCEIDCYCFILLFFFYYLANIKNRQASAKVSKKSSSSILF